jgi:hypothetical protein
MVVLIEEISSSSLVGSGLGGVWIRPAQAGKMTVCVIWKWYSVASSRRRNCSSKAQRLHYTDGTYCDVVGVKSAEGAGHYPADLPYIQGGLSR